MFKWRELMNNNTVFGCLIRLGYGLVLHEKES